MWVNRRRLPVFPKRWLVAVRAGQCWTPGAGNACRVASSGYRVGMEPVNLALPADLARDLAGNLRRAVAGRQLREVLARFGSDLDPDQAMQIALDEQRAHRRMR